MLTSKARDTILGVIFALLRGNFGLQSLRLSVLGLENLRDAVGDNLTLQVAMEGDFTHCLDDTLDSVGRYRVLRQLLNKGLLDAHSPFD